MKVGQLTKGQKVLRSIAILEVLIWRTLYINVYAEHFAEYCGPELKRELL